MLKKKMEVVELNKKEEKIVLEETQSALILFLRRNRLLIFLTLLILSLTVVIVSIYIIIKNIDKSEEPIIKETSIDTTLDDYLAEVVSNNSMTDETASEAFQKGNKFTSKGEVLLTKTVEAGSFIIKFYSDGTALRISKTDSSITRIKPLSNGNYGIDRTGIIDTSAETSDISISKTNEYPWGIVTYYSDGSAAVSNSKMDIFVRDSSDITDNYISNNKVTYLKETKTVGNIKINYYYDGTIEVIKNNVSYLVRDESDLDIRSSDVIFKNNNAAEISSTKKMSDGITIDYYTDGGAIIRDGNKTLSVRKSNSIVIKDNKIYEIVDNIYVEISKKDGNTTYYTNGGAVVEYNGKTLYVNENSHIKYQNNNISKIEGNPEELKNESNLSNENIKNFDKTSVVTTDDYIAIVPKDNVILDSNGKVKDITNDYDDSSKTFTITNNTNEKIKYRVVIEESSRTTVDTQYLRYQLSTGSTYIKPSKLDDHIWKEDNVSKNLNIKGTNYILIEDSLEPLEAEKIRIMLWSDYDTIPNSQQNKYFYGTIRVYAWTEE